MDKEDSRLKICFYILIGWMILLSSRSCVGIYSEDKLSYEVFEDNPTESGVIE